MLLLEFHLNDQSRGIRAEAVDLIVKIDDLSLRSIGPFAGAGYAAKPDKECRRQ
jgi:hypothetical protein